MRRLQVEATDALILVDVQNDFLPGGPLPVPAGDEVIPALNSVISLFQWVVSVQDWHPDDHRSFSPLGGVHPPHCLAGTKGAARPAKLDPSFVTYTVHKGRDRDDVGRSGFEGEPNLAELLRDKGVERVFVGGLDVEGALWATARDAAVAGFEVLLLGDAVRSVGDAVGQAATCDRSSGCVVVAETADLR